MYNSDDMMPIMNEDEDEDEYKDEYEGIDMMPTTTNEDEDEDDGVYYRDELTASCLDKAEEDGIAIELVNHPTLDDQIRGSYEGPCNKSR
jgi:hypothetical protein